MGVERLGVEGVQGVTHKIRNFQLPQYAEKNK